MASNIIHNAIIQMLYEI